MGNLQAGEVEFDVDGKSYVLRCDVNVMIAVQQDCKLSDPEFWAVVGTSLSISLPMLRAFFYRGAKVAGVDKLGSWDDAGRLVTTLGVHRAVQLVSEAITWCLPPKKEREGGTEADSPPRPSTGPTST